ncbi:hypothetical protein AMC94_02945 [Pseudomonas amygdali pv. aesculi]|nr:hypothetical protein [Pseudomonas amygdali]KWT14517.1 hypothetical protein AL041_12015 [Pseudomonas amygdali pv. aesculi]KWT16812.1 hypothetical protein AL043_00300 [Pseudomonas amygdali pv. aesculi]KWT23724.1 hypothetical protein AL044_24085 [Pseudomonas amygdali pv. aesculi]KWT26632.1 hypothetical protein AL042_14630 [Pseudomonas amygdali pv. aesculi]KWT33569.1 hypothetical protein AMC94_02945 [Pseudomonas amygdali pv. aesculi]
MHEHAFGHLGTLRANFSITQCRHYIRDVHKALSLQLLSQGVGHNIIWVLVRVREPLIYSIFRPGNALEALIYLGATAGF